MSQNNRIVLASLLRLVLVCAMVIGVPNAAVYAAPSGRVVPYLQNGSFETYTGGVPNNWTVTNGRVNLGVDTLGGCVTQDTVNYAAIFTRSNAYGTVPVWPFPSGTGPKPTADNDAFTGTFSSNAVTTISGTSLVPTQGTNAYLMTIASGSGSSGHVVHGPAVVSDAFQASAGQVITMNWFSAAGGDDFAVLGYLLDTSTCTQTTIFETTGTSIASWQFASVTIPADADTYRFVFVSGTFDKSGGAASGSKFWLDNISQGTAQTASFDLSGTTANYASGNITPPFQLPGTSSSGMALSYASSTTTKCTVTSAGMLTVVAAGTCTITATQSGGVSGGTLYASSPSVTQSITITAISATAQTITFAAPADRLATDGAFSLTASATSGMAVTFSTTTTSVCTVASGTVTLVAAGTCTIKADQAGGVYSGTNYSVAPSVTRSFLVKGSQTITFAALDDKDPTASAFGLSATASSTLAVTYSTTSTGVCSVTSAGTVTILGPGTCTLSASQAGGATGGITYAAATTVTQSLTVRTAQSITFVAPSDLLATDAAFDLTASASSGLVVAFTSTTPSVCTIASRTVTLEAAGTCTIRADQSGGVNSGTNYAAAPAVTRSFLSKGSQTIIFGALGDKDPTAGAFVVTGTSSAGLTVTYSTTSAGVCSVTSGGTVTILGPGTCTIRANQAGGATGGVTYVAADTVTQSFTVRTAQAITFATPAMVDQDVAIFPLTATASSGLAVAFTSSTPLVCTVTSTGDVTMVSYGTCTITAAQVGGMNSGTDYSAAPSVTRSFTSRRLQNITFGALSDKDPTAANFSLNATASSTLAVSYSTTSSGICSVTSAGTVTILGPGTCTMSANQAGGVAAGIMYAAAPAVNQSFTVRTGQTISFAAPAPVDENAASFPLTATASSGLAVAFTSSTPLVCTVTSTGDVTMESYGTCTITAAQVGGMNSGTDYSAAPSVTRSFTSRRLQNITFGALSDKDPTAANFGLSATASSTLAVSYSTTSSGVCRVTSVGLVTNIGPGTCTIRASQAGGVTGGITYAAVHHLSWVCCTMTHW